MLIYNNMNSILNKLNQFNEFYVLEQYQTKQMDTFDSNLLNELNLFQKYELSLNQEYFYINGYEKIDESIMEFGDIKNYNISFNELLAYLDKRLKTKLSEDIKTLKILDNYKIQYQKTIDNFKNKQYIEFMYMAPTLIENILKKFLIQINGDVLTFRSDSLIEKTLNQIIAELIEDENCYIDKYILRYISYILVDNDGLNLRNNILHGNFSDNYFFKTNAMFIYVILIYLIRYFKYDQD